jgi:hypothetical protein
MEQEKKKNIVIPVLSAIILLLVGVLIGWKLGTHTASQVDDLDVERANKQVGSLYANMNQNLYQSIDDAGFVSYASTVIENRCPYYKPDGITYRQCLSDWEEELSAHHPLRKQTSTHAFCGDFTAKYTDPESLQGQELFLKCSIYKFK